MEIQRTFDLIDRFIANPTTYGQFILGYKYQQQWQTYNVHEYKYFADTLSNALLKYGIVKGDKVATITNNRPEWNFADIAIAQVGAIHVPIHPTLKTEDILYILNHSDTKFIFISDFAVYEKLKAIENNINCNLEIFAFDDFNDVAHWKTLLPIGEQYRNQFPDALGAIKKEILEDDILTIIYTSGTTGLSKGVMLTHKNIMSNAIATANIQHLNYKDKVLSFLPLSHVFEHMVNYQYQYKGVSIYYAESLATIAQDIQTLQVNGFLAVPRLLESIFEKIMQKAKTLSWLKRMIFSWALLIACKYKPFQKHKLYYRLQLLIADKLVFSKWRKALSNRITFIGCGGAALQPRITKIFWAARLPIFEGYGLTETAPVIAVNYSQPNCVHVSTVGPVLEGVEVKIASDGEILVRGPGITRGYYKEEKLSREIFDEHGWLHTGDIGEMVNNRFLKITDRKKEIFKTSNGKYIAPQQIENKLKQSDYIQHSMVFGDNLKSPNAIISPNFNALSQWCNKHKITFRNKEELLQMPMVIQHFDKEIKSVNRHLNDYEKINKIILISDEWSPNTGELSYSLKLRRKFIMDKYQELLDSLNIGALKSIPVYSNKRRKMR